MCPTNFPFRTTEMIQALVKAANMKNTKPLEGRAMNQLDKQAQQFPIWLNLKHFDQVASVTFGDGFKLEDISKKYNAIAQQYLSQDDIKNWNFIKMHLVLHMWTDITEKGATRNYNTKPSKKHHRSFKKAYQSTNFKNVDEQILRKEHYAYVMAVIQLQVDYCNDLDAPPEDLPAEELTGDTTLIHQFGYIYLGSPQPAILLEDVPYANAIWEYRYMKVNYESKVDWCICTDYLRCNPSFYSRPRYDHICFCASGHILNRLPLNMKSSHRTRLLPAAYTIHSSRGKQLRRMLTPSAGTKSCEQEAAGRHEVGVRRPHARTVVSVAADLDCLRGARRAWTKSCEQKAAGQREISTARKKCAGRGPSPASRRRRASVRQESWLLARARTKFCEQEAVGWREARGTVVSSSTLSRVFPPIEDSSAMCMPPRSVWNYLNSDSSSLHSDWWEAIHGRTYLVEKNPRFGLHVQTLQDHLVISECIWLGVQNVILDDNLIYEDTPFTRIQNEENLELKCTISTLNVRLGQANAPNIPTVDQERAVIVTLGKKFSLKRPWISKRAIAQARAGFAPSKVIDPAVVMQCLENELVGDEIFDWAVHNVYDFISTEWKGAIKQRPQLLSKAKIAFLKCFVKAPIDLELLGDAGQSLRGTDPGYLELISWDPVKEQYMPFPPVLYPDCVKLLRTILYGQEKKGSKSTIGKLWGITQVTFILSKDSTFEVQGAESKINYHLLFEQYKQTLLLSTDRKQVCNYLPRGQLISGTRAAASSITPPLAPDTARSAVLSYGVAYTDTIQLGAPPADIFATSRPVSNATPALGGASTQTTVPASRHTGQAGDTRVATPPPTALNPVVLMYFDQTASPAPKKGRGRGCAAWKPVSEQDGDIVVPLSPAHTRKGKGKGHTIIQTPVRVTWRNGRV
ncbi:hypothetical protein OBBRIDRAFT_805630 [Obba rivulosa]|uniref:Uncharacterized protein n=1 Tax=Obba rivulosa TaxID=1052685 RepID=A0A8E2ATF8_9APHY|nr:hypothetical protein OBBRIDRAFT_805630 [Obba rivulosa]